VTVKRKAESSMVARPSYKALLRCETQWATRMETAKTMWSQNGDTRSLRWTLQALQQVILIDAYRQKKCTRHRDTGLLFNCRTPYAEVGFLGRQQRQE